MKPWVLVIILVGALAGDWIFQRIMPGMIWLAPVTIIVAGMLSRDMSKSLPLLAVAALVADLFSGFPFGIVACILYATLGTIAFVKTRINFRDRALPFLLVFGYLFSFEFFAFLCLYVIIR